MTSWLRHALMSRQLPAGFELFGLWQAHSGELSETTACESIHEQYRGVVGQDIPVVVPIRGQMSAN
jgi:hypothetical protein